MMALGKVAMMPEHYWRDRDSSKTSIEPPLSSGPYRVGKFEMGKYIEFERVPDYWGRHIGLHRGRHNLDIIRYEVYRDATVQREALLKGLLDVFFEPSAAQWAKGYDLARERSSMLIQQTQEFSQYNGIVSALAPIRPRNVTLAHMAGHDRWCSSRHRGVHTSSDQGTQNDVRRLCNVRCRDTKSACTDDGD